MNATQSVKSAPQAAVPKAAMAATATASASSKPKSAKRRRPSQWEDVDTLVIKGPIKATMGKVVIHPAAPVAATAQQPRAATEPSLIDRLNAMPPPANIIIGDDMFFFGQPMSLEECKAWAERLTRWCLGS